jgi:hypothetical protein
MGGDTDHGFGPIKRLPEIPKEMVRWPWLHDNGGHAMGDKNGWSHKLPSFKKTSARSQKHPIPYGQKLLVAQATH